MDDVVNASKKKVEVCAKERGKEMVVAKVATAYLLMYMLNKSDEEKYESYKTAVLTIVV